MDDVLSKFRVLLQVDPEDMTEIQAKAIWAKLGIINSKKWKGEYEMEAPYQVLHEAFDAVATVLVGAPTSDDKIEGLIFNIVAGFSDHNRWMQTNF